MNIYLCFCQLIPVTVLLLLLGIRPASQTHVSSRPLETRPYEEIIQSRGRVSDSERLERLISRYRNEHDIEQVDRADSDGQPIAWVNQSREMLELGRRVERLRIEALRSIDVDTLTPQARVNWRALEHLFETWAGDLNAENAQVFPLFQRIDPPEGAFTDPPQTYSEYEDRIAW